MSKIKTAFSIIRIFKNWLTYFGDHFRLFGKKRIIYYLRNGIKYEVRTGTYDHGIINEIWMHRFYNPKQFEIFEIKENDIVFDIGAQIGVFSVFASKFAKNGKIFSFEPTSENFTFLKRNIELNKIKNIVPVNKAVSGEDGEETIFLNENNTGGHSFFDSSKSKLEIRVTTISLKSFIKNDNISKVDFLKMDCEGAEYKILFSCPIEVLNRINKISMEYHNIDDHNNVEVLKKYLENNGFKVTIMDDICPMLYAHR